MSFALAVKKELLTNQYSLQGAIELMSGLIATSITQENSELEQRDALMRNFTITIANHEITNLILEMFDEMKIKYQSHPAQRYILVFDFPYQNNLQLIKTPSWYFAGAFIGGGSISKLSVSSYHCEIQLHSRKKATEMMNFLNQKMFNFNLIQRRKMWVIYLKQSDQISDFLKMMQAFNSLISFEDERIKRDYNNHINRYSNLDTYNLQKVAKSNVAFSSMYKQVKKAKLLHLFNQKELNFFNLKLKNQYISLQELTNLYNQTYQLRITKSGLNHYLLKLKKVFDKI